MENQDYSQQNGGQPLQSSPNNPAVGTPQYWDDQQPDSSFLWEDDAVPPMPDNLRHTATKEESTPLNNNFSEYQSVETGVTVEYSPEPAVDEFLQTDERMEVQTPQSEKIVEQPVNAATPVPPPFNAASVTPSDIEGIYEAVNSVFEKVEKFQDIIKIQNKTIDRFSKGIILEARKPLLMELCDLYETVTYGIQEDDKAVYDRFPAEERCRMLRAKLDELLQVIQCTLEDYQVEIKRHPNGTDELAPYQSVTGREVTDDIYRFANFDSSTNAIYVTDRCGFVVKTTEVSGGGSCKVVEHILRPEEVTKVVLKKD